MKELSKTQLKAAAKAYVEAIAVNGEYGITDGLRAAAPFLQVELEDVTTEERTACRTRYGGMVAGDMLDDIIAWLIKRRKAALLPEMDERFIRIKKLISGTPGWDRLTSGAQAGLIVAALGEGGK